MKESGTNWQLHPTPQKFNLDKTDKEILKLLIGNSRTPLKEISKKIKISKVAIFNRIKKLEQNKVITGYSCLINFQALGFDFYNIGIKTKSTLQEKQSIISKLEKLDFISQILHLSEGRWELLFRIITKKDIIQEQLKEILEVGEIEEMDVLQIDEMAYSNQLKNKIQKASKENISISKFETKLLYELAKNSKQKSLDIAIKLNTSASKISKTIKSLQAKNIIFAFSIHLNPFILGSEAFLLAITTKTRSNQEKILNSILPLSSTGGFIHNQNPNIITIHIVNSLKELVEVENKIRKYQEVKDYKFIRIISQIKYNFFPKEIFQELISD